MRAERTARGWSQARLAGLLHIDPAMMSRYERAKRDFPLPLLVRAAEVLGVPVSSLLPDGEGAPATEAELLEVWAELPEHRRRLLLRIARDLGA